MENPRAPKVPVVYGSVSPSTSLWGRWNLNIANLWCGDVTAFSFLWINSHLVQSLDSPGPDTFFHPVQNLVLFHLRVNSYRHVCFSIPSARGKSSRCSECPSSPVLPEQDLGHRQEAGPTAPQGAQAQRPFKAPATRLTPSSAFLSRDPLLRPWYSGPFSWDLWKYLELLQAEGKWRSHHATLPS